MPLGAPPAVGVLSDEAELAAVEGVDGEADGALLLLQAAANSRPRSRTAARAGPDRPSRRDWGMVDEDLSETNGAGTGTRCDGNKNAK
ncbi:MAG: hypothetical protein NVSMB55_26980 [Mycobacteriales bacterium]